MKKFTQSEQQMRYRQRRAHRAKKARKRFKDHLTHKNRFGQSFAPVQNRIRKTRKGRPKPYGEKTVVAPTILSFVDNPEEVSRFIQQLNKCYNGKRPVWVYMKDVKRIDYDGLTVLLSVMVLFKAKRLDFNGDFPDNSIASKTLLDSHFFYHLFNTPFRQQESYEISGVRDSIVTHGMKTVEAELGESLIYDASETVWGQKRRCPGVQRTLIELMQNTNNHASLQNEGEKHWWLSVRHIKDKNRVAFSFVDYGVGVFVNLRNKRRNNKFYGAMERLLTVFRLRNNGEVLRMIFNGELHKTATGKPYRGKGLPGIYEAFSKNKISRFAMVTNNVYYNSVNEEYKILNNAFEGTFVYWELCPNNSSLPFYAADSH